MSQVPVYLLLSLPLVGAFAMFALGIVVIFQSSRVLNLAHGAMAMVPPYVLYELTQRGVPIAAGVPIAVLSGAAIGAGVERLFVRNLRRQGPTGQTVGTVAALGVLVSLAVKIWGTTPRRAATIFPDGGVSVGASRLSYGQMGLFAVAVLGCAAMFLLFTRTPLGLAMRVAADNRRAASLAGIDADRTTTIAWMLGGALAAVAGVLLAAVTTLHPYNLSLLVLPGFVAALIGGLGSLPGALAGAGVVGLAQGMVPAIGLLPVVGSFARQLGAPQLVLTIVAFVVMYLRGTRFTGSDVRADVGVTPPAAAGIRDRTRRAFVPRVILAVAILAWPLFDVPSSWLTEAGNASITTVVAVSLVLLTGWVGQVSLAQATFVGIGAFATAQLTERASLGFPLSLPFAGAVTAAIAVALGVVALRVRGLYLAVASLIFVWMSSEYLFAQSWLAGVGGSASIPPQRVGTPGAIPSFEFSDRRTFYYVAAAAAATAVWGAANLRDSKTGRAFFAVRGSEMAAASLGIDVIRYKLLAFAASGFLAGVAGNLLMVGKGAAQPSQFALNLSLFYVAVAVVGGLTSLGGAIAAAILFAFLDELFLRVSALAGWLEVVGAGLLASALLLRPGGLASLAPAFRRAVAPLSRAGARLDAVAARVLSPARGTGERAGALASGFFRTLAERIRGPVRVEPLVVDEPPPAPAPEVERPQTPAVLSVDGLVVRFGGLTAVDGVAVQVREREIVGLIGPNGAGKTTIFNAISGLNEPAEGAITLFGRDVTDLPVHRRAALGMARTFQVIQLFPQISVFDNLLVATHLRNRSTLFGHLTVSRHALLLEEAARHRVQQVIDLLGLHDVAGRTVAGLPFGVLRLVELARAAVTGARFIMLDEPASGLDNTETERMIELLRFVRDRLGATILLIEHDVPMVTAVSDHIYVVNRGRPLAQGRPAEIQRNEDVIAAYLGRPTVAV